MEQYFTLFGKADKEFTRFWVSVSTEVMKDGKGTGKYAQASMQARVSEEVKDLFDEDSGKTKTKGIRVLRVVSGEFYIMAARSKDRDVDDYPYLYIKKAKVAKDKKRDSDEEDDE